MNKITLLGTGTSVGVPMVGCRCEVCMSEDVRDHRLRTSAWVNYQSQRLLIDIGPDFRQQALRHNIREIDAVLLTHAHRDHVAGYDDLRGLNFVLNQSIPLYAASDTYNSLMRQFYYAFEDNGYKSIPQSEYLEITYGQTLNIGGAEIQTLKLYHGNQLVMGFRFGTMAYMTDVNHITDESMQQLKGVEVLILDALRREPHSSHFSLSQSLEVVEQLKPKRTVLIHIGHQMGLYSEIAPTLPKGVELGVDNMTIEF